MRLGIMSFAHLHAEGYLGNLGRVPGVEVIGFSDTDQARGRHFSEVFGVRWFQRHEDLLAEGLDGAIVCSENARRRELVAMAAAAGAHVLCEKPIEVTLEAAEAMGEVCRRHGVHFMTAFPMRFDPSVRIVKALLARGELGELYGVNGVNHSETPRHQRAWFAQKDLAGGGAVMDHTVHLVDLLRWYLNCEVAEVYAEVGNPFCPGEVDVDTAGLVTLTFENGVFASIDCSWSRPTSYPRWGHLKMELVGERGAVSLDALAQAITAYSGRLPRNPTWLNWGSDANQAMLEEFVASIREGCEPAVTWRDGYEALRVALACYESAEREQPVVLRRA
ncbi:Gfo/Idh/MocA family oxidoreductase [soil metagenome]|jgi:predicted dehydrogenase|nr:Gfo/Idh/MocA family oxidoreductase [Deinococcota bacterium]